MTEHRPSEQRGEKPYKGIRRFVFVQAPRGTVKHLMYTHNWLRTACGRPVGTRWKDAQRAKTLKGTYCRKCEVANV